MNGNREILLPIDPAQVAGSSVWLQIRIGPPEVVPDPPVPPSRSTTRRCQIASGEGYIALTQGCESGPFTVTELRWLVSMGTLHGTDRVRREHEGHWQELTDLVGMLPVLPAQDGVSRVRPSQIPANEDGDDDGYNYPPFNGIHWSAMVSVGCGILAVLVSLSSLSHFLMSCVLLSTGFVFAIRACQASWHWGGMLIPVLSLWLLFMIHADHVKWMLFATRDKQAVKAESREDARPGWFNLQPGPAGQKPDSDPAPVEIPAPESPEPQVVWVEFKANP